MPTAIHSLLKTGDKRAAQGASTRRAILRQAVDLASAEGLEGLTIGRLATEMRMSKSGLFAHFGSKEDLQLATVEAARSIFIAAVAIPANDIQRGLLRLWNLCNCWLHYAERHVFRGGCFFAAASAEFDSRPGPVRDRIAEVLQEWLGALESSVREAQEMGHLDRRSDAKQLAFEVNALGMGANWAFQLYDDKGAFGRAREAIRQRLTGAATKRAPALRLVSTRRKAKQ